MKNLDAPVFGLIVGLIFILLGFSIVYIANPKIEEHCLHKGGQVIATPGRLSSCLYSPQ